MGPTGPSSGGCAAAETVGAARRRLSTGTPPTAGPGSGHAAAHPRNEEAEEGESLGSCTDQTRRDTAAARGGPVERRRPALIPAGPASSRQGTGPVFELRALLQPQPQIEPWEAAGICRVPPVPGTGPCPNPANASPAACCQSGAHPPVHLPRPNGAAQGRMDALICAIVYAPCSPIARRRCLARNAADEWSPA